HLAVDLLAVTALGGGPGGEGRGEAQGERPEQWSVHWHRKFGHGGVGRSLRADTPRGGAARGEGGSGGTEAASALQKVCGFAGRTPAWACPAPKGRETRQTSPLIIRFHLPRQSLDQLQRLGPGALPGVELFLQLRRDLDRPVNDVDFHERPFGQWRVGDDHAV